MYAPHYVNRYTPNEKNRVQTRFSVDIQACRLLQTAAKVSSAAGAPAPSELSDETYRKNYHLIH